MYVYGGRGTRLERMRRKERQRKGRLWYRRRWREGRGGKNREKGSFKRQKKRKIMRKKGVRRRRKGKSGG